MGLTLESEQRLTRVSLVNFFSKYEDRWKSMAVRTHKFLTDSFPKEANVRVDDLAKALLPVLEVDEKLADYLNTEKLGQKYWIRDFCDLILDRGVRENWWNGDL